MKERLGIVLAVLGFPGVLLFSWLGIIGVWDWGRTCDGIAMAVLTMFAIGTSLILCLAIALAGSRKAWRRVSIGSLLIVVVGFLLCRVSCGGVAGS